MQNFWKILLNKDRGRKVYGTPGTRTRACVSCLTKVRPDRHQLHVQACQLRQRIEARYLFGRWISHCNLRKNNFICCFRYCLLANLPQAWHVIRILRQTCKLNSLCIANLQRLHRRAWYHQGQKDRIHFWFCSDKALLAH